MATTTNYGWTTPDDTALVKDGAAAIRSLGTSIDTTTKNLNPSTTLGDIEYRSSTSNTNTRLAIGSSGQALTVVAGVPSWAASPTSVLTTTGDLLYASAANTLARLGIGSSGNVLTVSGGLPTWAAPSSSVGSFTLLNSGGTALTGSQTITISGISNINTLYVLVMGASTGADSGITLRLNGSTTNYMYAGWQYLSASTYAATNVRETSSSSGSTGFFLGNLSSNAASVTSGGALITGCNTSGVKVGYSAGGATAAGGNSNRADTVFSLWNDSAVVTSIAVRADNSNFDAGTVYVYGSAV